MYELNKVGAELDRWVDDLLDNIKHSDEMSHSYKGSEWKDHKYVKKEDGRYYYPKESAASGAYDNDIEFKKDKIEELYNIKIHHTEALQKAIESGDTASADKYKEYIKNIDAQMAALQEEVENLSSHAHPNFKTPDNARRLNHSELMHYGVGPDDNPPGRGSGRYPKGSGERPFQHDPNHDAGEKKKGLFSIFKKKDKPVSVEEAFEKSSKNWKDYEKIRSQISRYEDPEIDKKLLELFEKHEPGSSISIRYANENLRGLELDKEKEDREKSKNLYTTEDLIKNSSKKSSNEPNPTVVKALSNIVADYKTPIEKIDAVTKDWLSFSSGGHQEYRKGGEFAKKANAAADLGLAAIEKLRGPNYIDSHPDKNGHYDEGDRKWFLFEDQTIGLSAIASMINQGYSAKQVKQIIRVIEDYKDSVPHWGEDEYKPSVANTAIFDVDQGNWDGELARFADACEEARNERMKHSDDLLDDFLAHYGVGPDDNPPGRGSGRYPKGSGDRPFQHDPEEMAKKKRGLFGGIKSVLAKRKANTEIDRYRDYVHGMLNGSLKNNKALHEKYKELNERTDGKLSFLPNGDPSYDGADGDRPKLAEEWKKFSEEVVDKHAKAEARSETLQKARETKAANKAKAEEEKKSKEAREAAKNAAIASGDPERISKWLSEMSDQEQIDAINRIKNTQDIKSRAAAQRQEKEEIQRERDADRIALEEANRPKTKEELRKERFDKFMTRTNQALDTAKQVRDMAEKGIDIWNTVAAINNTFNSEHELPMIKRTGEYFKEKADKEAAKIRRQQQLEDAKIKRENDLADALRKEQREDAKWEKEFQVKYGKASDEVNAKSKQQENPKSKQNESKSTEPKQETPPERSSETRDWYAPNNIARALLTSTPESRRQAADIGTRFWMTVINGGNQALNPSTARESERDYYRDRVNENKRYNDWESEQARKSAERMRLQSESTKSKKSQDTNEQSLKRMAQQYKYAQSILETRRQQRNRAQSTGTNLDYYDKAVKEASEDMAKLSENYEKFRKYL